MTSKCEHTQTSNDGCYEYCEDCGAVREVPNSRNRMYSYWHTCDLCRLLFAAKKQEVRESS